ncbi:hypothetical protein M0805_004773 [Coniferiporia weirii]|nr:hypothetical protein M0805_004773 [Coniferiporia weirii]
MSTLTVALPDGQGSISFSGEGSVEFAGHRKLSIVRTLRAFDGVCIYRAKLDDGLQVLLKASFNAPQLAALRREAHAYTTLLPRLQGSVVLRFYGFYIGKDVSGREVGAFVTEDSLAPLGTLTKLTPADKLEVMRKIGSVHLEGLQPEIDLAGNNIVRMSDGSLRIVHFPDLQTHDCGWDGDLREGAGVPSFEEFKCGALLECGKHIGIWKPCQFPVVYIGGEAYIDVLSETLTTTTQETVVPPSAA